VHGKGAENQTQWRFSNSDIELNQMLLSSAGGKLSADDNGHWF